ncbi:hypothetical protein ACFY20_36235 [Streptomyces sp. NPDC001312]|uniref:hypothetical protein n=1 Tax=Streptomyces sp. NPDC001312 TaxID=3364561 RepID=UPI003695317B
MRESGCCWGIEEYSQAAKGQTGLDHYQVRGWTAGHRYITPAMLALAFLAAVAASALPSRPAATRLARSSDPIDLTVPEVQHLFEL